jgi:hypothetical protein
MKLPFYNLLMIDRFNPGERPQVACHHLFINPDNWQETDKLRYTDN